MPWFRTNDGFPEHPKCDALAELFGDDWQMLNLAFAAWHHLGCDCAARLTDGAFKAARAYRVLRAPREAIDQALDALVAVGLLKHTADGFLFHDWAEYQPTRAQVVADREAKTERQNRWRAKKAPTADGRGDGRVDASTDTSTGASTAPSRDASTEPSRDASGDGRVDPAPSRPVPARPIPKGVVVGRAQPAHASVRADARDSTGTPIEAPEPEAPPAPPPPQAAPPPAPPPRGLGAQRDDGEKLLAVLLAHGAIVEPTIPEHDALCIALGQLRRPSLDRFEETFEAFAKAIATHEGRVLAWPYLAKYDTSRILTASWLRACRPERNEQSFDRLRDGFDTWRASDGRRVATAARAAAATLTEGPLVDLRALVDPTVATLVSSPTMEREANERMARYGLSPEELAHVALLLSQPSTWWPESGAVRRDPPRHVTLDDLAGYRDREVSGYEWKPLGALVGRARADLAAVRAREQAIAASASQYTGPKPLTFSTPAAPALTDPNACSPEERASIARKFRANLPVRRPAAPAATRSRYDDLPTDDQLAADAKAVTHG